MKQVKPVIDHIQITVKDLSLAEPFYDKLLPILGFDLKNKASAVIEEHDFRVVEYLHPLLGFAITSPRTSMAMEPIHRRRPGSMHHLAFKSESQSEILEISSKLRTIGVEIVDGPRLFPEYTPQPYFALFFKDLEGLKYEVVCTVPNE